MARKRPADGVSAVVRAEAAAGGMRALARLLGVSPSTIHAWRTKGPSARGVELLKGVRGPAVKLPKGVAGPVRKKAQQLLDFVKKFEKRSESAKKAWATRRKRASKSLLFEEWADIHSERNLSPSPKDTERVATLRAHVQNHSSDFRRFMTMAANLSFSTREGKDFWFSPKAI